MSVFTRARRHLASARSDALGDAAGVAALAGLIFAALTLPGLI